MTGNHISVDQIRQLAEDVRLIKDFAENHNFDASLIRASLTPANQTPRAIDWPVLVILISFILLLVTIAVLNFFSVTSDKARTFIFLIGMVFVISATVASHKKFENIVITSIVGIGVFSMLLIGTGVFTPKEVANQLQQLRK